VIYRETSKLRTLFCQCYANCKSIGAVPHIHMLGPACADGYIAAPLRWMPFKLIVTRCGVVRVQKSLQSSGVQGSEIYKSYCDTRLCRYIAAPTPRSRVLRYGRRCRTRPLRRSMRFGRRIPVARLSFTSDWVDNYGCATRAGRCDLRLRCRHHLCRLCAALPVAYRFWATDDGIYDQGLVLATAAQSCGARSLGAQAGATLCRAGRQADSQGTECAIRQGDAPPDAPDRLRHHRLAATAPADRGPHAPGAQCLHAPLHGEERRARCAGDRAGLCMGVQRGAECKQHDV
jgi:hypothetical protein